MILKINTRCPNSLIDNIPRVANVPRENSFAPTTLVVYGSRLL